MRPEKSPPPTRPCSVNFRRGQVGAVNPNRPFGGTTPADLLQPDRRAGFLSTRSDTCGGKRNPDPAACATPATSSRLFRNPASLLPPERLCPLARRRPRSRRLHDCFSTRWRRTRSLLLVPIPAIIDLTLLSRQTGRRLLAESERPSVRKLQ